MRPGHVLTLGGALVVLISLWMPWYAVDVQAMRAAFDASASQLPQGWAQLFDGLTAALPASLDASGWEALGWADIALVAVVAGVGALTLLAPRTPGVAQAVRLAGVVAAVVVVAQILDGPDPNELFSLRTGPWVALAGVVAMIAGTWWGAASTEAPSTAIGPPAAPTWAPPAGPSVPPPG